MNIDLDKFISDVIQSPLAVILSSDDLTLLSQSYESNLMTILDNHAPPVHQKITSRPDCEWVTDELLGSKQELRKLECQKLCTGLEIHAQIFKGSQRLSLG